MGEAAAIDRAVMGRLGLRRVGAGLLDLDNRKGKAPGGFCDALPVRKMPLIFMNAVGLQRDRLRRPIVERVPSGERRSRAQGLALLWPRVS